MKSLEKLTQAICSGFGSVHIFQKRFQISSSLKKGMERHRVVPPLLLRAGGPAAEGGPGRWQQQDWGVWLHSQGGCWGLQHHLCFADSEAAYLQRCHPYPGHRPALKAEGERWSVTGGVCQHSDSQLNQPPQNWVSGGSPAEGSWVWVQSKASEGLMGQKSLANILSVLHPPVSVPYTKSHAQRDQKITAVRCSSKKTKEIRDVPY